MKITKLLYFKYVLSFSICLVSCFIIFFIFSLIGNLNEDYLFSTIIKVSLLNSLQILMYVPSFIFLVSVILFTIFLKSKNEIIIIKSYLKTTRLIAFFIPIVIFFIILEINKQNISLFLEDGKSNLTRSNDELFSKIIINKGNDYKTFMIFSDMEVDDYKNTEYRFFKIVENKIHLAEYSNNIIISNNVLTAKNYTNYNNNLIEEVDKFKEINVNLIDLIDQYTIVKDITKKNKFKLNAELINVVIFFIIFFNFVFLIFFNRRFVNLKENLIFPIFICFIFLIYSFFVFNSSLNYYNYEFEVLASVIVGIFFLKYYINE